MPKALGIDYGLKRVGVAISDETKKYAFVFATIPGDDQLISRINDICQAEKVDTIIVGLPLDQNGKVGKAAQQVKDFVKLLEKDIQLKVVYEDERFSTTMAAALLKEAGKNTKKARQSIDQNAAQIILQTYLDRSHGNIPGL